MSIMQPGTDNKAIQELRDSVRELCDVVKDFNQSTKNSSLIMGIFTAILVFIAIYQFVELFTIQIPFIKLQAQLEIKNVIESCKINSEITWFDSEGNTRKCSEMPREWFQK